MDHEPSPDNRAYLIRCVADGLLQPGCNAAGGDILALTIADWVVRHLVRLGFVVVRHKAAARLSSQGRVIDR